MFCFPGNPLNKSIRPRVNQKFRAAVIRSQAILAYPQSFPTLLEELRFQSVDITVGGQEAAVKWRIRLKTKTGNVFFMEGIGVVKVNEDGKIQSARNFFDLAYFQSQLMQ